jgi:sugar phosphate isomerase/epimerase
MTASWIRAAVLPAEPAAFVEAVHRAAGGFSHVEVAALVERPAEHLAALADTGLFVACASLGRGLGAEEVGARRRQLERQQQQVSDAARLGATLVYLTPPVGEREEELACFAEGCELLAAFAASRMVRLAVQPAAGACLPDVTAALAWLEGREGIELALAGPSAEEVRRAGRRLGYVRLDGAELDEALREVGFRGVMAVGDLRGSAIRG